MSTPLSVVTGPTTRSTSSSSSSGLGGGVPTPAAAATTVSIVNGRVLGEDRGRLHASPLGSKKSGNGGSYMAAVGSFLLQWLLHVYHNTLVPFYYLLWKKYLPFPLTDDRPMPSSVLSGAGITTSSGAVHSNGSEPIQIDGKLFHNTHLPFRPDFDELDDAIGECYERKKLLVVLVHSEFSPQSVRLLNALVSASSTHATFISTSSSLPPVREDEGEPRPASLSPSPALAAEIMERKRVQNALGVLRRQLQTDITFFAISILDPRMHTLSICEAHSACPAMYCFAPVAAYGAAAAAAGDASASGGGGPAQVAALGNITTVVEVSDFIQECMNRYPRSSFG